MGNFRQKMAQFMYGRNGVDSLNRFILYFALALYIIGRFAKLEVLMAVALALLLYQIFRTYSRNLPKRQAENAKYVALKYKVQCFFKGVKTESTAKRAKANTKQEQKRAEKADSTHIYLECECGAKLRVPKNVGKIELTCPKCGKKQKLDTNKKGSKLKDLFY